MKKYFNFNDISLEQDGRVELKNSTQFELDEQSIQDVSGGVPANWIWCDGDKNDRCSNLRSCEGGSNQQFCGNDSKCSGTTNGLGCSNDTKCLF